jgi:glycosyltransferase involved in cell wall biosynthesis
MRILHVAAMPFPSVQGTQALIDAMLCALHDAGHDTHLLCYAHGLPRGVPYALHRARDVVGNRSLSSGPSLAKLFDDVALTVALRKLVYELAPDAVVAHHVEAALAVMAAGVPRWHFVAHTSLSAELGDYFSPRFQSPLALAGRVLDSQLCARATHVSAVSPLLASRLSSESGRRVSPISLPWTVPAEITPQERRMARDELGIRHDEQIVLYAGNLDAYQGLCTLSQGLAQWLPGKPGRRLLVATNDPRSRLSRSPIRAAAQYVSLTSIDDERARRRAHAAADVAVIPRKSPGGLPIKLLDALARGLPALAVERATCGLQLGKGCRVLANDDACAWPRELERWFSEPRFVRDACSRAGRETVSQTFAPGRFVREIAACATDESTKRKRILGDASRF